MKLFKIFVFILAVTLVLSLGVLADGGSNSVSKDQSDLIVTLLIIFITPAAVAFIMMFVKLSQMKTAVKQNYADNYMKRETFELTRASDIYLYSNTVRTPRPKSKN